MTSGRSKPQSLKLILSPGVSGSPLASKASDDVSPPVAGGRAVRSSRGKRNSLYTGFIDSSTLVIDSDDEEEEIQTKRARPTKKARHHSPVNDADESDFENESDVESVIMGFSDSPSPSPSPEPEEQSPPLALKRFPETYKALQNFQHWLGPPPPDTDDFDEAIEANASRISRLRHPRRSAGDPRANKSKIVKLLLPPGTSDKNASFDPEKVGFMDFPGELRNQIYFLALKTESPVDFRSMEGFPHHAAFLRVNKTVYNEARQVLYSQNRFFFDQNFRKVGDYFDPVWREAGYTPVRKFLTDIGPVNTSYITNIAITLVDSSLCAQPSLSRKERYFQNNKDLYWILKYLSRHAKIEKLILSFDGRAIFKYHMSDAVFLHTLAAVKTDYLAIGTSHATQEADYHRSFPADGMHTTYSFPSGRRMSVELMKDLYGVMVRPKLLKELGPDFKF